MLDQLCYILVLNYKMPHNRMIKFESYKFGRRDINTIFNKITLSVEKAHFEPASCKS